MPELRHTLNAETRHFSLEGISANGGHGYLMPQMSIQRTHRPIPISLYDDGTLYIGAIRLNTKEIMPNIRLCAITATAYEHGMIGVNFRLHDEKDGSASVYFKYNCEDSRQKPLYLLRDRYANPHHTLKHFSCLSVWQKVAATLLPRVCPRVTA